ncbi:MAG: hypothetical protein WAN40_07470 [Thermoplasmata archaeon]
MAIVGLALVAAFPMGLASATGDHQCPTNNCSKTPPFLSSSAATFNSVAIPGGDVIWFSSELELTGAPPTSNLTVVFTGQTLTFTPPGGTPFVKHVPKGEVLFSTTATSASTTWNAKGPDWVTTVPIDFHGNVFLSGYSYYVGSGGLPGNTQVNWSGRFASVDCLFQLSWKWTAQVYTQFAGTQSAPNYSGVDVQATDSYGYHHDNNAAGTPLNFQTYLTQGAMGGGGNNNCHNQGPKYSPSACVLKPHCF